MALYRALFRPVLFRLQPEWVHNATLKACSILGRSPFVTGAVERAFGAQDDPMLHSTVADVDFPNPVGLSAGYDKNGSGLAVLSRLGFGYVDVGSVSWERSEGNRGRPRLFRLPEDEALMVNYGVPNDGAQAVHPRLARHVKRVPVAVTLVETNTGRQNTSESVIAELAKAARLLHSDVDILCISSACPNDPNGRRPFSDPVNLRRLFDALGEIPNLPPVILKIQVPFDEIESIVEATRSYPFLAGFLPGIVPPRPYRGLRTPQDIVDGLPGTPTGPYSKSFLLQTLQAWYSRIDPSRYVLIANGGIGNGQDAYEAIRAGASLVGLVTALIYEGPGVARKIAKELSALLRRDGFRSVRDAVGAGASDFGNIRTASVSPATGEGKSLGTDLQRF